MAEQRVRELKGRVVQLRRDAEQIAEVTARVGRRVSGLDEVAGTMGPEAPAGGTRGGSGGGGGQLGGTGGGGLLSGIFSFIGRLFGLADGGVFDRGHLVPFAAGGVVDRPMVFPMFGGRTGLMGEAGPEAIMPLRRGADGRLGVESGGGGGITITNNNDFRGVDPSSEGRIRVMLEMNKRETLEALADNLQRGGRFARLTGRR